ncbi:group II intron maturase-specific domain-containing protein [Kitasatospora sp. NPDC059648]|uniref:group II intron maturase-specific domain-containing protein n=1 Tax=Kitasatospora sp. NPDC059648 TaxID=3346894 RepID=UPI0036BE7CED
MTRGWANYFKHAVAKHVFDRLDALVWWRLIRMLRERHRWSWGRRPPPVHHSYGEVATDLSGRGRAVPDCIGHGQPLPIPGQHDPQPMAACEPRLTAETVESPLR